MRAIGVASLVYFGIVFAAGFLLGTVRVLWLLPALGERYAELLEIPVMVMVSWVAAGFVVKRLSIPGVRAALTVGALALALLLLVEFSLVLGLRGLTFGDYVAARDPVAGAAYAFSLLLYCVFPAIRKAAQEGA